jgi:hypothetical protein
MASFPQFFRPYHDSGDQARDQYYVSSCGICGVRSMGQFSFRVLWFPLLLHSHISLNYYVLCLILALSTVLK